MIHPTAVVSQSAKLGNNVKIGPFCTVGDHVQLGDDVELISHVVVTGHTQIGAGTKIYPFASVGSAPQDLKFKNEPSEVIIGTGNIIREYVTIQPGTESGIMKTVIGNNCLLMVGSHVAHDCIVGSNVILANYVCLAGHVTVEDFVIIGGLSAVSQFVRIGAHAFVGGCIGVSGDVIPFGNVSGYHGYLNGLNVIGLKRRQFGLEDIKKIREVYNFIFLNDEGDFMGRVEEMMNKFSNEDNIRQVIEFIKSNANTPILRTKAA